MASSTDKTPGGRSLRNVDERTVAGFGDEWSRFDQSRLPLPEAQRLFSTYFKIFPWAILPADAIGVDVGCGSGRWAQFVAPRVGTLHCVDASRDALEVARRKLSGLTNCQFHLASVDEIPLADGSLDFGYSLGVLHHVPDPQRALNACVQKLKFGAPFLVYLYYALDNKPRWFRAIWRISDVGRRLVSRLPLSLRYWVSQLAAALVYLPLAKLAAGIERLGLRVGNFPLSIYRHASFYTMRTDALDRFGTRLEKRFTANEIRELFRTAGLDEIAFHTGEPYWCAVGLRRR